jgi:hypothetical protein
MDDGADAPSLSPNRRSRFGWAPPHPGCVGQGPSVCPRREMASSFGEIASGIRRTRGARSDAYSDTGRTTRRWSVGGVTIVRY